MSNVTMWLFDEGLPVRRKCLPPQKSTPKTMGSGDRAIGDSWLGGLESAKRYKCTVGTGTSGIEWCGQRIESARNISLRAAPTPRTRWLSAPVIHIWIVTSPFSNLPRQTPSSFYSSSFLKLGLSGQSATIRTGARLRRSRTVPCWPASK